MSAKAKIMGICLLLMGALFTFLGLQARGERAKMEKEGISVPGQIVSAKVDRNAKGKKRYYLQVTWSAGEAKREAQTFSVKKAFFETKVQNESFVTAAEVTVRYVKGDEANAIIVGGSGDNAGMEYVGFVILLIGLWASWRAFFGRRA